MLYFLVKYKYVFFGLSLLKLLTSKEGDGMNRKNGAKMYIQMIGMFMFSLSGMFLLNYVTLYLLSNIQALHITVDSTKTLLFVSLSLLFFFVFALVFEIVVAMFMQLVLKTKNSGQKYIVSIVETIFLFFFLLLISNLIPGLSLSWISMIVLTLLFMLFLKITENIHFSYVLHRIARMV